MLNPSASLAMSKSVLEALPGKLDIKRHSPSILYIAGVIFLVSVCLSICEVSRHNSKWYTRDGTDKFR